MQEITIRNWRRSRSFGFGWSSVPTGHGTEIMVRERPDYTGTYRQVLDAIEEDRAFASTKAGGAYYSTAWFYRGQRIVGTRFGSDWHRGFFVDWLMPEDHDLTIRVEDQPS